jgi:3-oxoacyl-[acyl-carrier protein] reductase
MASSDPKSAGPPEVALVTGASRGIGRAIAIELGVPGRAVVVNYHSRSEAAAEVVAEIEHQGGTAVAIQADVGQTADRERLVRDTIRQFGRIDILVNNAGITSPGRRDILEATEDSWDQVLSTNLKGPFFLTQLVAREMIDRQSSSEGRAGKIITISSISALAVSPNRADYCIAKAALGMMTEVFAVRLADHGITVFEICPGIIASDMTAPVRSQYDERIRAGLSPIRRWGQPEDVASVVGAIADGAMPFCTGQRILVDGGLHIRRL